MTHSLSTPSGVDGSAVATNHTRGGGKKLAVRVQMLDDSMTLFQVQVLILLLPHFLITFFVNKFIAINNLHPTHTREI
jgi:FERM/RhoGEF/pleckstrin domain protein 2